MRRFCFGDIGLYKLLDELESSLPSSFAILASELRGAPKKPSPDVHLPAASARAVIPPAPPIPRQSIFALKDIKWRNPHGRRNMTWRAFQFANVPEALAHKALDLGVAVLPESEQAQKWKYTREAGRRFPEKCIDLETGELPKPPSGPCRWKPPRFSDRGGPVRMSLAPRQPSRRLRGV